MLAVLQFIFQDFWHWLGTFILVAGIFGSLAQIFRKQVVIIKSKEDDEE